jgi:hypothetical protein
MTAGLVTYRETTSVFVYSGSRLMVSGAGTGERDQRTKQRVRQRRFYESQESIAARCTTRRRPWVGGNLKQVGRRARLLGDRRVSVTEIDWRPPS